MEGITATERHNILICNTSWLLVKAFIFTNQVIFCQFYQNLSFNQPKKISINFKKFVLRPFRKYVPFKTQITPDDSFL